MSKFSNICSNNLSKDDLLSEKNNFSSENEQEKEININSNGIKEELKEKKENKEICEKGFIKRKNFVLKTEFYKKIKDSEENYSNMNNIENNTFINNYYNPNFIKKNIDENCTIKINKDSSENCFQNNIGISVDNNINKVNEIITPNLTSNSSCNIIYNDYLKKEKQNYNNYYNNINIDQLNAPLINNIFNIIKTNNSFHQNKSIYDNNTFKSPSHVIKNKYGCIMMKNKILLDTKYANEILFPQIKNDLVDLCCDNFGNYFLQAFLDIISFESLNSFLDLITKNFVVICISPFGTRVIQKIIDKIFFIPILINKFIYIINTKELGLICKSQYGNHIIKKFLTTFHSNQYTFFIYEFILNNFIDITNSKNGVFIVQKCISEGNQIYRQKLYKLILNNLMAIIQNEFGNYLIQFILLNNKGIEDTFQEILPIILKIEENIVDLCLSKFSANAIERCIENSNNLIRNHILNSFFDNHSEKILNIFCNEFGFYVLLKAAKTQNGKYKNKIIDSLNKNKIEFHFEKNKTKRNYKSILKIINDDKDLDDIYKIIEAKFRDKKI